MIETRQYSAGILHGAGYAGGELIRLLLAHPSIDLQIISSRSSTGKPVWEVHPALRGATDLEFSNPGISELADLEVLFLAAEHGQAAATVVELSRIGFAGAVVDLSTDFRFIDQALYPKWFGFEHPEPELLHRFRYGLPEVFAPYPAGSRLIANPGCFATAVTLALWPFRKGGLELRALVTALTGASGSGTSPKAVTHFPTRDGNVRAYKVLAHQHLPEINQTLGPAVDVAFVPASGPWTRGIWGTAFVELAKPADAGEVPALFDDAFDGAPAVRLWPDQLPEMRFSVGTPYCDLGWVVRGGKIVVGFALDNLLKGAASQAVQNMNLILGLPEMTGLIPSHGRFEAASVSQKDEHS